MKDYRHLIGKTFGGRTITGMKEWIDPREARAVENVCNNCGSACLNDLYSLTQKAKPFTRCKVCRSKTHGLRKTREYEAWAGMKKRCYNENCNSYKNYGGRGISVCDKWIDDFQTFYLDMGPCPEGGSIERIDCNKGYFPRNCRWASFAEQQQNKRTSKLIEIDGVTHNMAEWCRIFKRNYYTVRSRINIMGWPPEKALRTKTKGAPLTGNS